MKNPTFALPLSIGLLAAALASACGSGDSPTGPSCPNDLPATCPTPAPTYADVQPIIEARCFPCHAAGGEESSKLLETYAEIFALRSEVLTQVYGCLMPNASEGQPPLSDTDRATFLAWLVCEAPE